MSVPTLSITPILPDVNNGKRGASSGASAYWRVLESLARIVGESVVAASEASG